MTPGLGPLALRILRKLLSAVEAPSPRPSYCSPGKGTQAAWSHPPLLAPWSCPPGVWDTSVPVSAQCARLLMADRPSACCWACPPNLEVVLALGLAFSHQPLLPQEARLSPAWKPPVVLSNHSRIHTFLVVPPVTGEESCSLSC